MVEDDPTTRSKTDLAVSSPRRSGGDGVRSGPLARTPGRRHHPDLI